MSIIPKDERCWVAYYSRDHVLRFLLTSKETSREFYFLYQVDGERLTKLGKARSPRDLEEKFEVYPKLEAYTT